MVKLVWRTDVHLSDRAPASRLDDWAEMVLGKLTQVRDIAKERGACAILDGGDFFHIKSPSRNTHELVRRAAEHHQNYPCPVYCTPGNHDSVYGDYAFLGQQPLGVLYASQTFRKLYDEHEAVFVKDGVKVRVVGIPYHSSKYEMERFHSLKRGDEDILVCVAHVLASLRGGTMFEGEDIVRYSDLLSTAPDVYLFGHWHKDQGVEILGDKTFINIGSLTRGSISQDELQRRPACAVLNLGKSEGKPQVDVEVVRLVIQPSEKVFDVEGRARQVRQQVEMDSFVEKIRQSLVPKIEGGTLADSIKALENVPQEVRERALSYLEMS